MTEGYLVKTIDEEGDCKVMLWSHSVNVIHDEAPQAFVPIRCEKPRCSERKSAANVWSFPELNGSVNGLEAVRTLRFTHVYRQLADHVASLKSKVVGANAPFHLEAT